MSWLWLRYGVRQMLRTLGQHRAIGPLLVIGVLTIPTSIVGVHEMAPHAHTIYDKLGDGASAKLVYGFFLGMIVLLFPLQVRLIHELESTQEIENLERYPLPRRCLFHFKLIDQAVMYLPLLLLVLFVTTVGGLYNYQGLYWRSQLLLCGCLSLLTLIVHLSTMFLTTGALGFLPDRWVQTPGRVVLLVLLGTLLVMAAVAFAFPYYAHRRLLLLPWVLVPLTVELAQQGHLRVMLVPLLFIGLYIAGAYALAGWSYHRNLLVRRERLIGRLNQLMGHQQESARQWTGAQLSGLLEWWDETTQLLVLKDLRMIARPAVNRLIFLMFGLPFGFLVLFVGVGILLGAPSPFGTSQLGLFGRATLMLSLYGMLTLLWIPCAQIFLFSSERWPLTMTWFGPFGGQQIWKSKAVSAGLVVFPAVTASYLGMAMALKVGGGGPHPLPLLVMGLVFCFLSAWLFGSLVASLGILFPYYLQNRFRQLAGGMGFMMQLTLIPVWIQTWLLGLVAVQFFGLPGLLALVGCLLMWFGFSHILAREARFAVDEVRRDFGKRVESKDQCATATA